MPLREEKLSEILLTSYSEGYFQKPEFQLSSFDDEIKSVYSKLGGIMDSYPTSFRGFDICCKDFIVELDEEQHFNRYRLATLDSSIYTGFRGFNINSYKKFCVNFESECLSKADNRKYWSSDSTTSQFGDSSSPGILTESGSSRWKQRAFYDYLRDVGSVMGAYKLVRISIWDKVGGVLVKDILDKKMQNMYGGLKQLIEECTTV